MDENTRRLAQFLLSDDARTRRQRQNLALAGYDTLGYQPTFGPSDSSPEQAGPEVGPMRRSPVNPIVAGPDQASFLTSEKDTRPHWETDQAAMLMPLVMSGYNNSVSYGVPSFFGGHAWSTMGDIVKGNAVHPDEIAHSANEAAGAAMLGSMPMGATRRGASLGSGGGNTKAPDRSLTPSLQGQSDGASRVLAETDKYDRFLQRVQDRFDEYGVPDNGPVIGPRTPGIDDGAVMAAAKAGFNSEDRYLGLGKTADGGVPEVGNDASVAHVASALWDAAKASGRKLEIAGDPKHPYKSAYGFLDTPAGGRYKVRVADHSNTSSYHDRPDFNIAPGAMTPDEFIALLPKIYSNPKTSAAAPLALEAMKDKGGSGIRAYHGSPHDYNAERLVKHPDGRTEYLVGLPDVLPDVPSGATVLQDFPLGRVRMDKIGTGEGAQAFGHGWYAAENEGVAKSYRDILQSPQAYIGNTRLGNVWLLGGSNHYDPGQLAAFYLQKNEGNVAKARAEFDKYSKQGLYDNIMVPNGDGTFRRDDTLPIMTRSFFDRAEKEGYRVTNPGRMYEVNIKADPNHFLDWDKPLSQQSEGVRSAIERVKKEAYSWPSWGDGQLNEAIHLNYAPAEASAKLRDAGIPGIKYLDQGSRGAGEGSRNYVVFDDKLIEILRKYGLAGILAGGYAMTGQEPQE